MKESGLDILPQNVAVEPLPPFNFFPSILSTETGFMQAPTFPH